jgi:hypothetical protein
LRIERAQATGRLDGRTAMPCGRKLRIQASKHFVASGPLRVRQAKDTTRTQERDPRSLRLLPSPVLPRFDALGDPLLSKLGAIVELEGGRLC